MGLDVYYYKMKARKTEQEIEKELEDCVTLSDFTESNVVTTRTVTHLQKTLWGSQMPKQIGYGRKIWATLDRFSRGENLHRLWDVLDIGHIIEMRDLSRQVSKEQTDESQKDYYQQQARMFSRILRKMEPTDQILVIYSY